MPSPTTSASPPRTWRGVPLETRRAERRELLIDTAFELLGSEGWSGLTVRGVCQAAPLNPRYFYESFDSLEALFIAVFDRLVLEATHDAVRAVAAAGPDPGARAVAVIDASIRYVTADPRRARILFVEALGNEAVGQRRWDTLHATAAFLERSAWRQTGLAEDRIGLVASHLVVGGLTELVVTWLDGRLDITLDQLVEDAAALMVAIGAGAVGTARADNQLDPIRPPEHHSPSYDPIWKGAAIQSREMVRSRSTTSPSATPTIRPCFSLTGSVLSASTTPSSGVRCSAKRASTSSDSTIETSGCRPSSTTPSIHSLTWLTTPSPSLTSSASLRHTSWAARWAG